MTFEGFNYNKIGKKASINVSVAFPLIDSKAEVERAENLETDRFGFESCYSTDRTCDHVI